MIQHSREPLRVSIIVPVYNEEDWIDQCLRSLVNQTVECEILVVNDGSTDGTVEIVRSFATVQVMTQHHQGPGKARNLAARHARGDILVFCDADQTFAPDYIEKLIAPILTGQAIGTYSREEYVANFDNVWARCWNLDAGIPANRRHPDNLPDLHPVFRAIRRDSFLSVGGYEDVGYGEDHTLAGKLGQMAVPAPGATCYHYNPGTLREVLDSACWYGKGRQVGKDWKAMVQHSPPWAVRASLKRAIVNRTPQFVLYKIVQGLGVIVGIIAWRFSGGRHAR